MYYVQDTAQTKCTVHKILRTVRSLRHNIEVFQHLFYGGMPKIIIHSLWHPNL